MATLQCEICGGKLVGKPGGLFECEYCGMEYNTDWAKAKIQEIKGTVQVEGTVQVTGTVKVDTADKVENLIRYVQEEINNLPSLWGQFGRISDIKKKEESIEKTLDDILRISPDEYWIFLYRSMKKISVDDAVAAISQYSEETIAALEKKPDWNRAMLKAPEDIRSRIYDALEKRKSFLREQSSAADSVLSTNCDLLKEKEENIEQIRNCLFIQQDVLAAHNSNGDVLISFAGEAAVSPVKKVIQVVVSTSYVACLHPNGTVTISGENKYARTIREKTAEWEHIIRLCIYGYDLFGIDYNGAIYIAGYNPEIRWHAYRNDWQDVVAVCPLREGHSRVGNSFFLLGITESGEIKESTYASCKEQCRSDSYEIAIKTLKRELTQGNHPGVFFCDDDERKEYWKKNKKVVVLDSDPYYLTAHGEVWDKESGMKQSHGNALAAALFVEYGRVFVVCEDGSILSWSQNKETAKHNLKGWKLFTSVETVKQEMERIQAQLFSEQEDHIEQQKRKEAHEELVSHWRLEGLCQHCGGELKGFFGKKCASCGKPKDY